jgi:hypothetical protein
MTIRPLAIGALAALALTFAAAACGSDDNDNTTANVEAEAGRGSDTGLYNRADEIIREQTAEATRRERANQASSDRLTAEAEAWFGSGVSAEENERDLATAPEPGQLTPAPTTTSTSQPVDTPPLAQ